MPDENSNLKSPAPAGRPSSNRRRGRRGGRGRGRGPRPPSEKPAEEISPAPEAPETMEAHDHPEAAETENPGGFREPHADAPPDFASHEAETVDASDAETVAENTPAPEPAETRPAPVRPREFPQRDQRPDRRQERRAEPVPVAQRQWPKPVDLRPAASSAIHEAVIHATEIAESLKHTIDQLDEILELVELAERQKLADEREIDELRRALRRINPPRQMQQPPPQRGPRRDEPRRDDSRQPRPDSRENVQRHEDPPRPPEADEPPAPPAE